MPVGPAGRSPRHPPAAGPERPAWLTIHEASDLIGVSEATLRRWAEAGDVEAFVTPGGHRRFTRNALLRLLPHPGRPHRTLQQLGGTPERMGRQYRRELAGPAASRWLPDLDEASREAFRGPGRQILEGVLGYLDAATDDAGEAAIATAVDAATEYGHLARARGLGTVGSTEVFLRFRSPFLAELGAIARRRRVDASEAIGLIIAAAGIFDRLLLALLEGHAASPSEAAAAAPLPSSQSATEA